MRAGRTLAAARRRVRRFTCRLVHSCKGAVIKSLPVAAFTVLLPGIAALSLFVVGGFVATQPGLIAVEAQAAERQDAHFAYYQVHLARSQMSSFYCR